MNEIDYKTLEIIEELSKDSPCTLAQVTRQTDLTPEELNCSI